jgi:hypothetical protein
VTSLFVGVASVFATIAYNRWAEGLAPQNRLLPADDADGDGFWLAFNEAPVVFASNPAVVRAHQLVLGKITKSGTTVHPELVDLLRAMAGNLRMERGVSEEQLRSRFRSGYKFPKQI